MKRPIRSFSQAAKVLEDAGIAVTSIGRLDPFGPLMWRVEDKDLDKDGVIRRAIALLEERKGQPT